MAVFGSCVVSLLPILFLTLLFGGEGVFRRRHIDQDGVPPIDRRPYLVAKYSIVLLWVAMAVHCWGVRLAPIEAPSAVNVVALVLWIAGFALLFTGRFGLGESFRIGSPKEDTCLKVDGLFRLSRNPMYLGVYATLIATILHTLNPVILAIAIFIFVVHHKIVLAEEQFLMEKFGDQYARYCGRVRRYI